ncbi:reverse transcriptase domain-containing protein, partial [Tanacetum coccineum]
CKDSNIPGKKVPKKVLRYFLIIRRLLRLYKSRHTVKEMTWHATRKCTELGKMQQPVDGRAWKNFDTKYLDFKKEPRIVRLGLAADGFNPFGNLSQSYSMWPVVLTTYNLPLWLCMKESSFMLTLLIPGPKSLGKDIDVYLRPLIDDLKVLWAKPSVETIAGSARSLRLRILSHQRTEKSFVSSSKELNYQMGSDPTSSTKRCKTTNRRARLLVLLCNFDDMLKAQSKVVDICSATLMEDDMLKAQSKICELHANNLQRPEVSTTSEFFSLANGPSRTPMSVNACVVDGVRYVVQSRDEPRTTQNSGICAPGPDGEMSYGQLQEILEFKYLSGVIVVENEPDIIHLDNSSDLPPSTSGNDLDNVTFYIDLHIDGESTEVDAPPDIIDVPGEDDDISDDEDPLPHDLADSDVEDLINDDDGVEKVYSSEEED